MSKFHDLTVTHIDHTTRDAVVLTLKPESGDFGFTQGQYLTFRRDFDGEELRRSYSICSGADEGVMQVGIKRVDGGAFSTWANSELKVGDRVQAMPPAGRFFSNLDPAHSLHYLTFAAGSGITPILSIIKTTLSREPDSRVTLVYANRNIHSVMFRDTLEDLKNQYMGRLNIIHILKSDAQDIELFHGRLDADKCTELFSKWLDISTVDMAFICGPEQMMHVISDSLKSHGLAPEQIKFELFEAAQPGRAPQLAQTFANSVEHVAMRITLDGITRDIQAEPGQTVLEAARANGLDAPYSCTAGVCSTCRCKVISGEVEMAVNHALEDDEVGRGFALSCQARPLSDSLEIDYDSPH